MRRAAVRSALRAVRRAGTGSQATLTTSAPVASGQNVIEKIVARHVVLPDSSGSGSGSGSAVRAAVRAGAFVSVAPRHVMTHDNTAAVMQKYRDLGLEKFRDPRQPVYTLDHNVQDRSEANLEKYRQIEAFAAQQGVDFYPAGRGIGHQVMVEEGYAFPSTMVVASDSHSNMYGGIGCLGTPVVRTDAASIWATGTTWWQVPQVAKVNLVGRLRPGVVGKDVIVTLCGIFNRDEVLNHAIEFGGDGIAALSVDERLTIANMTTEWGALAGVFPVDDVLLSWLDQRVKRLAARKLPRVPSNADQSAHPRLNADTIRQLREQGLEADADAHYAKVLTLDLDSVVPHVSGPNEVKRAVPVRDIARERIAVHKAYLVSCVNSRVGDIAEAARIVRGQSIPKGVEFYIAAASSEVQSDSEELGDWQTLLAAGAIPLPPGCGPCIGLGKGLLQDGEVGISATNRNFKGRMGSRDAQAFLASPSVVAASAVAGYITGPDGFAAESDNDTPLRTRIQEFDKPKSRATVSLKDGFPREIEGQILMCMRDNINTDGIYPGKYTYREDITPQKQAEVAMENYDTGFSGFVRPGQVLVAGSNFGTGSSREQAATALKHAGVAVVITGSVNETYKRNALNNGLLVLEMPGLVADLRAAYGAEGTDIPPTMVLDATACLDFAASELRLQDTTQGIDRTYAMNPVGEIAQELVSIGGLEPWIRASLGN